MRKSKKAIIVFGIILLILVTAIAGFIAEGNQIISGMFIRDDSISLIVNENGRIIVLHETDKDEFSDYNDGDIITVVSKKEEFLIGGYYGTMVDSYFSFRTKKRSANDVYDYFKDAGKNIISGRFLRSKNGVMLIDENGGAIQLCNEADIYLNFHPYRDGDKIIVLCSDILETYPGRADVYFCWLVEEGDYSDLPESTLASLREMGWID